MVTWSVFNRSFAPLLFSALSIVSAKADPLDCTKPFPSPLTFASLRDAIQQCDIQSIEQLLPFLPDEYHERYTLMYASRSLQAATAAQPRVISFGANANLILAFSNVPGTSRFDTLETTEFDAQKAAFTFREIQFPKDAQGDHDSLKPVFSQDNPALCLTCHKQDPRPNWGEYFLWAGAYGAEDDGFFNPKNDSTGPGSFPAEKALYKTFDITSGRYASLKSFDLPNPTPPGFPAGLYDFGNKVPDHNLILTTLLGVSNGARIARLISALPGVQPYRYLFLAALTCAAPVADTQATNTTLGDLQDITTYVPADKKVLFPKSIDSVYSDLSTSGAKNFQDLVAFHFKNLNITQAEDPRVQNRYTWPVFVPTPGAEAEEDYGSCTAQAFSAVSETSWALQPFGTDMSDWATEFLPKGELSTAFHMVSGELAGASKPLWDRFIDKNVDGDLYPLYLDAVQNGLDFNYVAFPSDDVTKQVCGLLREKSLAALSI